MTEQPRVLFCCFEVVPGPTALSRRATEYIKALADRYQTVVLSTKTPDHSHIEKYHGARLLRVPVGGGDLQSQLDVFDRAVRRQLSSEEYVLCHFFDPFSGYAVSERRQEFGYRLVYEASTFPSVEWNSSSAQPLVDRKLIAKARRQELYCLMNADAIITGSETTRSFVRDLGVPSSQIRVLRAPVDLLSYTPELLGPPDRTPMTVLHLSHQLPAPGLDTVLRALSLAVPRADVRLLVIGAKRTPRQSLLAQLAQELQLTGRVEFQEPVPHEDLPKLVANCDVGLLSADEGELTVKVGGTLSALGEFLAGGRPVLAADLPVARELAPHDATLFYPPKDSQALATLLVTLATQVEQRVALGAAARRAAHLHGSTSTQTALVSLYEELLGERAGRPATRDSSLGPLAKAPANPEATTHGGTTEKRRPALGDPDASARTDPQATQVLDDPEPGAPRAPDPAEVLEVDDSEVEEIDSAELEHPTLPFTDDRVHDAEELEAEALEVGRAQIVSAVDFWLAQLVHGYCPPESHLFERPVPPTTMPGRDQ